MALCVGQSNENENNKNRTYDALDDRLRKTYVRDSNATLRNKLFDPYVRFFHWATDRLDDRDGIVCFITNNKFVHGIAFDGMRKHLLEGFTRVYHLDLGGDVRDKQIGDAGNVFGIRVGVGITIAIKSRQHSDHRLFYCRVPEGLRGEQKLALLAEATAAPLDSIPWEELTPDAKHTWLVPDNADEYATYLPMGSKDAKADRTGAEETLFDLFSLGVATNRDSHVYGFERAEVEKRVETFIEIYNAAVDKMKRLGSRIDPQTLIDVSDTRIKWTRQLKMSLTKAEYSDFSMAHLRTGIYRPFTKRHLYFDDFWIEERYQQPRFLPTPASEHENRAICVAGPGNRMAFGVLAAAQIPSLDLAFEKTQCFPFYVYDEDGGNRKENIPDAALARFRTHYGDDSISKWDIFHYVYALLHHPGYRERYAGNLKRELPRIPLAPAFRAFAEAGQQLAALHVGYESVTPYPLGERWTPGAAPTWRVEKMRLSADKTELVVNRALTLTGIPPQVFDYRLGSRSALDWVIDQYRVTTDKRSGITSDPNRFSDDEQYIVNLVKRVVAVSVETVAIVERLAVLPFR